MGSREFLQTSLFRKYLNYSERSRQDVQASEMYVGITKDASDLAEGYTAAVELLQKVGKLIVLISFVFLENPRALFPAILMPLSMIAFAVYRSSVLVQARKKIEKKSEAVLGIVQQSCDKYRLVADFMQRPQMADMFHRKVDGLGKANLHIEVVELNNQYFIKWLAPISIGGYIMLGSSAVLSRTVGLGVFIATIKIFTELSHEFVEVFALVMKVLCAIGPLQQLTLFFNKETDLMKMKQLNRQRRQMTAGKRNTLLGGALPGAANGPQVPSSAPVFRTDLVNISVQGLSYTPPTRPTPLLQNITAELGQGSMVAVVGPHGSGKTTLLRLLGHTIFPDDGFIFVPTHLRILHLEQELMFFDLSVWHNLTFGLGHAHRADPALVKTICEALIMDKTLKLLKDELEGQSPDGDDDDSTEESTDNFNVKARSSWLRELSYTEKAKMHLARALIVNPEMLVLQRPLIHYDETTSKVVMQVLLRHVKNRGFFLPKATAYLRRPRTCFFSPTRRDQVAVADHIWTINSKGSVTEIQMNELKDDMLP